MYGCFYSCKNILNDNKNKEIAVLTCMKKTTRALQMAITQKVGTKKNIIIDTVVPDYSYIRTLEPHLFNVATSRAREHTIIIADKYVLDCTTLDIKVRKFLARLKQDKCIYIPNPNHGLGKQTNTLDYLSDVGCTLLK